jgi:hypothetical protein
VKALLAEEEEKKAHVVRLESTTKKNMWKADLEEFEAAYNEWLAEEWTEANKAPGVVAAKGKKKPAPKKKLAKKPEDDDDWGAASAAKPAAKKVTGPDYSAVKAVAAKPAGGASTSKPAAAAKKKAAPAKVATSSKELKLADVFAKAATKKKAARPREGDSFSDSPVRHACLYPLHRHCLDTSHQ